MPNYRRVRDGGTYFFILITYNRLPILSSDVARNILHTVWKEVQTRHPFTIDAICLLREHIHAIWTLPEEDQDYSLRWKEIKRLFTHRYYQVACSDEPRNASRVKRGEATVWQRRFWEHTIRNQEDYNRHIDYIHFNPVKHGLVQRVVDWPWSSFHRFVKMGFYEREWGQADEKMDGTAFGE